MTERFLTRRLLPALGAALLLAGLWSGLALASVRVEAVSQSDIDDMEAQLSDLADEIQALEDQLDEISDQRDQALEELELLDQQIALGQQQLEQADAVLAEYDALISQQEADIAQLEEEQAEQYDLFCQQTRAMEEQGYVSYLAILFDSSSFSDLLDGLMLVGEVMDYHNDIITGLRDTQVQLQAVQAELETSQAAQQQVRDQQAEALAALEEQQEAAAQLAQSLLDHEAGYEAALQELEAENAQVEEELAQAREELAAQGTVIVSEGEWYWPVPGFYTLTSGFGWRIHPIYGTQRYHNGTDIGGSGIGGTEIGAAKSGVVTISQYSSSYGNYVVVTHADGYQTLYAHMSTRLVSVGDTVTRGQALGLVGSTGLSTGNHLHFEVWYNGTRTDPEQYYPELEDVFYRRYNAA